MEDWKAYKQKIRQEKEEHLRLLVAVMRIQKWWRRMMKIHRLGPFRKKKKTGKDKSAKAKKK